MEPERRCKSGMDGGLRAAVLFSPPLHLRMDDFLSNRWGPPQVSITQPLNTTGSMGRLTLNILLSFAEFERQMIADRTRDKMAAARRKGKWVGGKPVLGYDVAKTGGKLVVNVEEARQVQSIFALYLQ